MKLNHKVIMVSAATLMALSPVVANVSQASVVYAAKKHSNKAGDQIVLAHKSYVYDSKGKHNKNYKIGNKKWPVLGKGAKLSAYGTKKIDGEVYYFIGNNSYIKASDVATINGKKATVKAAKKANAKSTTKTIKLARNAYVYDKNGKRIKGAGTLKKDAVITYTGTKKIKGKEYFNLGKGQYVKTANAKPVKKNTSETKSTDKQTYIKLAANSVVYNEKGEAPETNKQILEKGTEYEVSKAKKINGKWFYQVGANQWIKADNAYISSGKAIITDPNYVEPKPTSKVDENATIVTLKTNASTYNSNGGLISSNAFSQGQSLRVSALVWIWVPSENQAVQFYKIASDSKSYIKLSDVSLISGKQLSPTNTADDARDQILPATESQKNDLRAAIADAETVKASEKYKAATQEQQHEYQLAVLRANEILSKSSATAAQVKNAINAVLSAKNVINSVPVSNEITATTNNTNN